jgi:quercetin dioxygenase-like cupin family protein
MSETSQPAPLHGETSGSPERAAQRLTGSALRFDLSAEAAQLQYERGYRETDRGANTLVNTPAFRLVLTALRQGGRLQEHQAPSSVAIQVVTGHLRVRVGEESFDLPAGHVLVLEPSLRHDAEALEDSVFLLTLAGSAPTSPSS